MGIIKSTVFLVFILCAIQAKAEGLSDTKQPSKVPIVFDRIHVPDDFDNNDNIQIIGEGFYPNNCFREAETKINIDHFNKVVYLEPEAYNYDGLCLSLKLPFHRELHLGFLKIGTYTVIQTKSMHVLGQIRVRAASSNNPDDYMYAPINQAYLQTINGNTSVKLSGNFPLRCLRIKEVKWHMQSDVIVVLPIAEMDRCWPCDSGHFPFETKIELGSIRTGHYLLNVQSMNGRAINTMVDIR